MSAIVGMFFGILLLIFHTMPMNFSSILYRMTSHPTPFSKNSLQIGIVIENPYKGGGKNEIKLTS